MTCEIFNNLPSELNIKLLFTCQLPRCFTWNLLSFDIIFKWVLYEINFHLTCFLNFHKLFHVFSYGYKFMQHFHNLSGELNFKLFFFYDDFQTISHKSSVWNNLGEFVYWQVIIHKNMFNKIKLYLKLEQRWWHDSNSWCVCFVHVKTL